MAKITDNKITDPQLKSVGMRGVPETIIIGQADRVRNLIDGTGVLAALHGLNRLIDFLQTADAAANIGADKMYVGDPSADNVQAKLKQLKSMIDSVSQSIGDIFSDPVIIPYGSITGDKLAPNLVLDEGGWDDDGETADTYNPYDFKVIGYGLDAFRREDDA